MRLIDADTVKAVFEEKSSVAVCGVKLCKAIIRRIDEVPTVEAIPVEWIKQYGEQNWFDYGTPHNAITCMLKAWEERKG